MYNFKLTLYAHISYMYVCIMHILITCRDKAKIYTCCLSSLFENGKFCFHSNENNNNSTV